jgi:protein involved in polysaccharide export with SLBB domain
MKNVQAQELSEQQIKDLIDKAKTMQYSDKQLEQMAIGQGMLPGEASKLLQRINDYRRNEKTNTGALPTEDINTNTAIKSLPANTNSATATNSIFENIEPTIFGSSLFRNSDISFQPNQNMPTPQGYIIGPGDELLIDLTGDNEANYKLKVGTDGNINIEYIGKVAIGGLSIEAATSKIKSMMSGTYPSLKSGRSNVSINLGNIRSIKVTMLGEIVHPGSYNLSSLSTVFNALYMSGGPNENGSFRSIEVIRNNRIITTVDIYDFLLKGIQTNNIRLQDEDVIRVPVFKTRVEVAGEVKRPAFYEILPGEYLSDVLNFAGEFTSSAYTASVKVFQNTARERKITDIANTDFANYEPHNGDKYVIERILDRFENRIEIKGAVFRPGYFELDENLTLKTFIEKAGGLKEDAFLPRGYIYRLKLDNTQELLSFNLTEIINGTAPDIFLQREDIIQVSSIFDLQDEYQVSVGGEVRYPGTFKYAEHMTLNDLIQMSGGFKEGASPNRIEVARRVKNSDAKSATAATATIFTVDINPDLSITNADFQIMPFDIITVRNLVGYEVQMQVKIEGEVLYPGYYTLKNKNERISDVIERAGGLTALAYTNGASLHRPVSENTTGKNAISNTQKKEEEKLYNLQRLSVDSTSDLTELRNKQAILSSDLVGIHLDRILENRHGRQDLILQNGDVLQIPRLLQTVKVNGEVLRPNNILYSRSRSFKSYINGAGGYTQNALKRGAFIQYANGSVAATKKFLFFNNYPAVKPGAEILVPLRAPRERIGKQGWIGLGTAVVTMTAMVFSLLKN